MRRRNRGSSSPSMAVLSLPGALRAGPRIPLLPQAIVPFFTLSVLFPTHYNKPAFRQQLQRGHTGGGLDGGGGPGHNAWVVAAVDGQRKRSGPVSRLTVSCSWAMEGVGLKAARNTKGMPLVMPPKDAPGVVGAGFHLALGCRSRRGRCSGCPGDGRLPNPAPNSMPFMARDAKAQGGDGGFPPRRTWAPPAPTGRPVTAHSTTPPTLSQSRRAASTTWRMRPLAAASMTGKYSPAKALQQLGRDGNRVEGLVLGLADGGHVGGHPESPGAGAAAGRWPRRTPAAL